MIDEMFDDQGEQEKKTETEMEKIDPERQQFVCRSAVCGAEQTV